MADTVKKTKATGTPRQASAKKVKAAEVAKPTTKAPKGIELVAKVAVPKKAPATKPVTAAVRNENNVAILQPRAVSQEMIELAAYQIWLQRGQSHGQALEDWIQAEQELRGRAS